VHEHMNLIQFSPKYMSVYSIYFSGRSELHVEKTFLGLSMKTFFFSDFRIYLLYV
jgi:hypothetical protein